MVNKCNSNYMVFRIMAFSCVLIMVFCSKRDVSDDTRGNLNLEFKFKMKSYTNVTDTLCGCPSGNSEIWAYEEPRVTIRDTSGKVHYQVRSREVNLINYPLQEGNYSVQYEIFVKQLLACDSLRDIWKIEVYPGSTKYCVNKSKNNYKSIDTTEYISVGRKQKISLSRNF